MRRVKHLVARELAPRARIASALQTKRLPRGRRTSRNVGDGRCAQGRVAIGVRGAVHGAVRSTVRGAARNAARNASRALEDKRHLRRKTPARLLDQPPRRRGLLRHKVFGRDAADRRSLRGGCTASRIHLLRGRKRNDGSDPSEPRHEADHGRDTAREPNCGARQMLERYVSERDVPKQPDREQSDPKQKDLEP
ncbi:MAG: hypothetical protein ACKOYN_08905 [Planctomycetota bacterium]